jgi:hypothetical protein
MKKQFKFIFVLVAGLLMSTGNAFAQQSSEAEALVIAMTAEVNQLMEEGKTLEEAVAITVEKNAVAIKNNPNVSEVIYKAVATVAASRGISPKSPQFSKVIAAVSNVLINTVGLTDWVVFGAASNAGIPKNVIVRSLPAPPSRVLTDLFRMFGISYGSSTSSDAGGNAGSPAT